MTTVTEYVTKQLAASGFAPIHHELAMRLRPDIFGQAMNAVGDFGQARHRPEQLAAGFPDARLYRAKVAGIGIVSVLSRHPQLLAERMTWVLGLDVSDVTAVHEPIRQPGSRPHVAALNEAVTSDRLAMLHTGVATREPARNCKQCGNLSSGQTCLAAGRGDLADAPRNYAPDVTWPRKCLAYAPSRIHSDSREPSDYDRRAGKELWPEVVALASAQVAGDSAIGKGVALLSGLLNEGPRDAGEIIALAARQGINERTMQRAAERLDVLKSKSGFGGGWVWGLAESEAA